MIQNEKIKAAVICATYKEFCNFRWTIPKEERDQLDLIWVGRKEDAMGRRFDKCYILETHPYNTKKEQELVDVWERWVYPYFTRDDQEVKRIKQ